MKCKLKARCSTNPGTPQRLKGNSSLLVIHGSKTHTSKLGGLKRFSFYLMISMSCLLFQELQWPYTDDCCVPHRTDGVGGWAGERHSRRLHLGGWHSGVPEGWEWQILAPRLLRSMVASGCSESSGGGSDLAMKGLTGMPQGKLQCFLLLTSLGGSGTSLLRQSIGPEFKARPDSKGRELDSTPH